MMRVGLLGMGTVGTAVARRLTEHRAMLSERAGTDIELVEVAVRHPERARDVDLGDIRISGDGAALVASPGLDIIVELIGGENPAGSLMEAALTAGRGVVTANKAVIARRGPELEALAHRRGVPLRYEAAVGGGMPVISLLRDSLRGDRIDTIEAVINGTTNFIIDRMSLDGLTLDSAVAEAQALGYAEADPSDDLDGGDAASKLTIMAALAFGAHVDRGGIDVAGIRQLDVADIDAARGLGCVLKLMARGRRTAAGIALSVRPTLIPNGHPLAAVGGAGNGVVVEGDLVGPITLTGAGAGGEATASAVTSDVVAVARLLGSGEGVAPAGYDRLNVLGAEEAESAAYLRIETEPDPEAAATIARMLEDRGVPVEGTVDQPIRVDRRPHEVLCLTGPAPRSVLGRALETLDTMASVRRVVTCLDRLTESA